MVNLNPLRNACSRIYLSKSRMPVSMMRQKQFAQDRCRNQSIYECFNYGTNQVPKLYSQNSCNFISRSYQSTGVNYAKNKDRGKDKKKSTNVQVNINEMSELINVEKLQTQLEKAVNDLKANYVKNLMVRSSLGSIEQLTISWDGKDYMLQELAQIARKPKMLVVNVSAFPQVIPNILETLAKSGMNLNPQQDGTTLFIPIPKVTKEHRENLAKNAKTMFIRCRDNIKDIQVQHVKSLKNKTDVSKDVIHNVHNQIGALADQFISQADAIYQSKCKDLLGETD